MRPTRKILEDLDEIKELNVPLSVEAWQGNDSYLTQIEVIPIDLLTVCDSFPAGELPANDDYADPLVERARDAFMFEDWQARSPYTLCVRNCEEYQRYRRLRLELEKTNKLTSARRTLEGACRLNNEAQARRGIREAEWCKSASTHLARIRLAVGHAQKAVDELDPE